MKGFFSPLDEAKWSVVHDFPGGAPKLAPLVTMRPGTLNNKVDPGYDGTSLFLEEAIAIQHAAKDYRILFAEAAILNHTVIPLGDFSQVSDVELLTAYARYHADLGDTAAAIHDTLRDGRVTRAEYNRVRQQGFQDIQCFFEFLARLEALIDE